MAKEMMKRTIRKKQAGRCALTGRFLPQETELFDTDRRKPKAEGGKYTSRNTRVVEPTAHMIRHGTLRLREPELERLKAIVDDREQMMKLKNKIENQIRAYKRRTDYLNEDTLRFLEEQFIPVKKVLDERTRLLHQAVKEMASGDSLMTAALEVRSVGEVTVAYLAAYLDLEEARHVSSCWAYVGLDKANHERYEKGKSGGGNKSLRTALYTMADSQVKGHGAYREVYDRIKARLSVSNKLVNSNNTKGKMVNIPWKDTMPSHRHGAALRAIIKHFLADYWFVGRTLRGLPTTPVYAVAMLGHEGHKTISPEERGWVF